MPSVDLVMANVQVQPSLIDGLGIFASRPFAAGDEIAPVDVVREITPIAPIQPALGECVEHCSYPDGKVLLIAFPMRHVNHSCDPNAYERFEGSCSSLVARRSIAPGEEITIDYSINVTAGSTWPCRCGSSRCRGEVIGDFFRLPLERQHEYRPLLAPWFVRRNSSRVDALDSVHPSNAPYTATRLNSAR